MLAGDAGIGDQAMYAHLLPDERSRYGITISTPICP
jgi:hypothetical protein